jgi:hypothetical protein
MELMLNLGPKHFKSASKMIKLTDAASSIEKAPVEATKMISKLAKKIKRIEAPVTRFFETPGQLMSQHTGGEYDLISVFKLLKYEPYFLKATQKKLSLLVKSGFNIKSNNDKIKKYMDARMLYMFVQTGKSFREIVRQTAKYLIISSNAFVIKVRDKDFEFGRSYIKDGKEMKPVVGLFVAHPTTMYPKFKTIKMKGGGYKLEIEKWIHSNSAGARVEFDPSDVCHFTIFKEDGMLLGMPEVIPVIDDIRTLRKIEEDVQLLIYRDLFPIIHYAVETPSVIDHQTGWTELDQARKDMSNIIQDGGIATDSRHEINFIGSEGKGVDPKPFLEYFRERVFSGLGMSSADMGLGTDISGTTATSMSKQLTDAVRFIQQELASQFNEMILTEFALQSPFEISEIFQEGNLPVLEFIETDIEWKIRKENHEADLFAKGLKTVDEVRNTLGEDTEFDLSRTFQGLFGQMQVDQEAEAGEHLARVSAANAPKTIKSASGSTKQITPPDPGPFKRSAADKDMIKSAKSNSNIVKSTRDSIEEEVEESTLIQDQFREYASSANRTKIDIIFATRMVYNDIKANISSSILQGAEAAARDLGIDAPSDVKVLHNLYDSVDSLCHKITTMIVDSEKNINRAAARVGMANRTEKIRGYNYGYAMTCLLNNKNEVIIYSEHDNVSEDSLVRIGEKVNINIENIHTSLPPFRTNSRLKIKAM